MAIDFPTVFDNAFLSAGGNDDFPSEEITYTQDGVSLPAFFVAIHEITDTAPTSRARSNVSRLDVKISLNNLSAVKIGSDKITRSDGRVYVVQGLIEKAAMCWHVAAVSM